MADAPMRCPSCGADVPRDRLSCPSCGTLLAAVTGSTVMEPSRRQGGPVITGEPPPVTPAPDLATEVPVPAETAAMPAESTMPAETAAMPAETAAMPAETAAMPAESMPAESTTDEGAAPMDERELTAPDAAGPGEVAGAGEPIEAAEDLEATEEAEEVPPGPPPYIERPLIHDPLAPVPPTPAYAARPPRPAPPAPPGPNEWFSTRAAQPVPQAGGQPAPLAGAHPSAAGPAAQAPGRAATPGQAGFLSDLPFDAPDTLATWLSAGGLTLLALAFLLPWAAVPGLGWFDTWGMRDVRYLAVFLVALVAALAVVTPSRVPGRVRFGYVPLLVGTIGVGLVWDVPVAAPAAGVWALAIGSLLALLGGLWTLVTADRRAGTL